MLPLALYLAKVWHCSQLYSHKEKTLMKHYERRSVVVHHYYKILVADITLEPFFNQNTHSSDKLQQRHDRQLWRSQARQCSSCLGTHCNWPHACPCLQEWINPQIWHVNFATPSKPSNRGMRASKKPGFPLYCLSF